MHDLVFSRSVLFLVVFNYWDKNLGFCPTPSTATGKSTLKLKLQLLELHNIQHREQDAVYFGIPALVEMTV